VHFITKMFYRKNRKYYRDVIQTIKIKLAVRVKSSIESCSWRIPNRIKHNRDTRILNAETKRSFNPTRIPVNAKNIFIYLSYSVHSTLDKEQSDLLSYFYRALGIYSTSIIKPLNSSLKFSKYVTVNFIYVDWKSDKFIISESYSRLIT